MIVYGILGAVILFMIVLHFLYVKETNSRIDNLIEALMDNKKLDKAKDLTDYNVAKMVEETPKEQTDPDVIPAEAVSDEMFEGMIDKQIKIQEEKNNG